METRCIPHQILIGIFLLLPLVSLGQEEKKDAKKQPEKEQSIESKPMGIPRPMEKKADSVNTPIDSIHTSGTITPMDTTKIDAMKTLSGEVDEEEDFLPTVDSSFIALETSDFYIPEELGNHVLYFEKHTPIKNHLLLEKLSDLSGGSDLKEFKKNMGDYAYYHNKLNYRLLNEFVLDKIEEEKVNNNIVPTYPRDIRESSDSTMRFVLMTNTSYTDLLINAYKKRNLYYSDVDKEPDYYIFDRQTKTRYNSFSSSYAAFFFIGDYYRRVNRGSNLSEAQTVAEFNINRKSGDFLKEENGSRYSGNNSSTSNSKNSASGCSSGSTLAFIGLGAVAYFAVTILINVAANN